MESNKLARMLHATYVPVDTGFGIIDRHWPEIVRVTFTISVSTFRMIIFVKHEIVSY